MLTEILLVQMDLVRVAVSAGDLLAAGREAAVVRELIRSLA